MKNKTGNKKREELKRKISETLTAKQKREIKKVVGRVFEEYGETIRMLGNA